MRLEVVEMGEKMSLAAHVGTTPKPQEGYYSLAVFRDEERSLSLAPRREIPRVIERNS